MSVTSSPSKLLSIRLESIKIQSKGIGSDWRFAIQVGDMKFSLEKKIRPGVKKGLKQEVLKNIVLPMGRGSIRVPVRIGIVEKDPKYDDHGSGAGVLHIPLDQGEGSQIIDGRATAERADTGTASFQFLFRWKVEALSLVIPHDEGGMAYIGLGGLDVDVSHIHLLPTFLLPSLIDSINGTAALRARIQETIAGLEEKDPAYLIKDNIHQDLSTGEFGEFYWLEDLQQMIDNEESDEALEALYLLKEHKEKIDQLLELIVYRESEIIRHEQADSSEEIIDSIRSNIERDQANIQQIIERDPRLKGYPGEASLASMINEIKGSMDDAINPDHWSKSDDGEVVPNHPLNLETATEINDSEIQAAGKLVEAVKSLSDENNHETRQHLISILELLMQAEMQLALGALQRADAAWTHHHNPDDNLIPYRQLNRAGKRIANLWKRFFQKITSAEEKQESGDYEGYRNLINAFCELMKDGIESELALPPIETPESEEPDGSQAVPEEQESSFIYNRTIVSEVPGAPVLDDPARVRYIRCQSELDRIWERVKDCVRKMPDKDWLREQDNIPRRKVFQLGLGNGVLLKRILEGDGPPRKPNGYYSYPQWFPGYLEHAKKIYYDPSAPDSTIGSLKHLTGPAERANGKWWSRNTDPYQLDHGEPWGLSSNRANWVVIISEEDGIKGKSSLYEGTAKVRVELPEELTPDTRGEVEQMAVLVSLIHELTHYALPSNRQAHGNIFPPKWDELWLQLKACMNIADLGLSDEAFRQRWVEELERLQGELEAINKNFEGGDRPGIEAGKERIRDSNGPFGPYFVTQVGGRPSNQ